MKKTIITILTLTILISCKKTFVQPDYYMLNFVGELQTGNPNDTHIYLKYQNYKYQINQSNQ